MNRDVLDCKRRAIRMESSENLPRNGNSRKRGSLGMLLFGAVEDVHESNYNEIASDLIKEAAIKNERRWRSLECRRYGFQRILANKSFKNSGSNLCDAFVNQT